MERSVNELYKYRFEPALRILVMQKSYLISETTKEERERIVADSLGNISGACDGCSPGVIEMYQDYIDGKKEFRDINMEFRSSYVSGNIDKEEKSGCGS